MRRRTYIISLLLLIGALTQVNRVLPGSLTVGDMKEREDIAVTATDAMIRSEIQLRTAGGTISVSAPDSGTIALAKLEVTNNDVTVREGPGVFLTDYTDMEKESGEIEASNNDIRLYGGSEGGHLPADKRDQITMVGYEKIIADEPLPTYPASASHSAPRLDPGETLSGWVFGVIPAGSTPRVRVTWAGSDATWDLSSAESL